jgi:hypothetical protein
LPFGVAFYERAGIEVVRYFGRALFFGDGDQTKSDDRSVAVLQDANVFGVERENMGYGKINEASRPIGVH